MQHALTLTRDPASSGQRGLQRLLREPQNLKGVSGFRGWELGQHSPQLEYAHQASPPWALPGQPVAGSLACLTAVPEAVSGSEGSVWEVTPGSKRKEWDCETGRDVELYSSIHQDMLPPRTGPQKDRAGHLYRLLSPTGWGATVG